VRADLTDAIAVAIDACVRPSLVFDRARIASNLRSLAESARTHGITALFAAKSFPHPDVWALAAEHCDGFDAASLGEVTSVPRGRVLSIVDPTGRAHVGANNHRGRLIVGCETIAQVQEAPAHAEIAIRVSASITGRDPAIGAVLDGSGHRRSRFGLDARAHDARAHDARANDTAPALSGVRDQLRVMARTAAGRPVGLHVHHGPVTATSAERFVATARAALDLAREAGVEPRFLDVGGAWHAIADLDTAFAQLRAAVPREIELIVEPGRAMVREAGFACGRVVVARELDDRSLRVVDLSRSCHLRWSQVELVGSAPHAGTGRDTLVVGPTCYEDDVMGEWTIVPRSLDEGTRFVLRGVTGYAVAWNTTFGGVPAADVLIV
jgi:diaminopimelate decarboxylase